MPPANRRSFVREVIALMPTVDSEFAGQIELLPLNEANTNELLLEITPSKGYYAHASFMFRVSGSSTYPFQKPVVSCLTSIFHPNIAADYVEDNVCLNLLNNWCARYGLKDLLNALLFLFYEPNFADPMNRSASFPEEGLSMEETIRKSFYGGSVNSNVYDPNVAWLRWADQNMIGLTDPSSTKTQSDATSDALNKAPTEQASAVEKYFRETLSGQFHSVVATSFTDYRGFYDDGFWIEFGYLRRITLRTDQTNSRGIPSDVRRYYYAEQCSYPEKLRIEDFDAHSTNLSTAERATLGFDSNQTAVSAHWPRMTEVCEIGRNEDPLYSQYIFDSPVFQITTGEEDNAPDECENEEETQIEAGALHTTDEHERGDGEPNTQHQNGTETHAPDVEQYVPDEPRTLPTDNAQSVEQDPVATNADEEEQRAVDIVAPDHNSTGGAADDAGNDIVTTTQDGWQATAEGGGNRDRPSSDEVSEISGEYAMVIDGFRCRFQEQQCSARQLSPWWWIFYQCRWPTHLAPRRTAKIKRLRLTHFYSRSTCFVLRADLYRLGMQCNGSKVFLLLDSMSLSPFSPIINRAAVIPDRARKTVTWYSLDWFSVADAFRSAAHKSALTPHDHFRVPPALVFTMFYVHNWLSYLSRLELYSSCLGYSRPLNAGTLTSLASTCLSVASMGCGQCGLLDVWPLWFMWRVSRVLCRGLCELTCVPRPGDSVGVGDTRCTASNGRSEGVRLAFPFTDLNEL